MVKILAPAGSLEGCAAALEAGAHGVYLGARTWSRGAAVHALTDREIAGCVNLARERDRVVHVAVNTIPACQDADLLIDKCLDYVSLGAGGLILNDFGLMAKLLYIEPAAPVYASAGCAIKNIADVQFYQNLGVAGVVLPPRALPEEIGTGGQVPCPTPCPTPENIIFIFRWCRFSGIGI